MWRNLRRAICAAIVEAEDLKIFPEVAPPRRQTAHGRNGRCCWEEGHDMTQN